MSNPFGTILTGDPVVEVAQWVIVALLLLNVAGLDYRLSRMERDR